MKNILFSISLLILLTACTGKQTATEEDKLATNDSIITLTEAQRKNAKIETALLQERISPR